MTSPATIVSSELAVDGGPRVRTEAHVNAAVLHSDLANVRGLRLVVPGPVEGHSYYKYYVYVIERERDAIACGRQIEAEDIPCFSGSCSGILPRNKVFTSICAQRRVRMRVGRDQSDVDGRSDAIRA